jgi:hypothetical protein
LTRSLYSTIFEQDVIGNALDIQRFGRTEKGQEQKQNKGRKRKGKLAK